MRTTTTFRRFVSAAVCAAITATMAAFPTATASAETVKVGKTIAVDAKYSGSISELGSDVSSITFYVTSTKACDFSWGFGCSTSVAPDYWAEVTEGKTTLTANTSTPIKIDVSKVKLGYSGGKYEFRNYYSEGSLTLDKVVSNDTGSSTPDKPDKPGSNNAKSGAYSFKDNKDGTATVSTTLSGTIDDIDAVLTAGHDEEEYTDPKTGASTWEEGDPINSRKLKYTDFGITAGADTKVTIESFTFSVSSETDMSTFMYGCGLNVAYKSDADSEYWLTVGDDPETKKGYWYNEHGLDEDGNPEPGIEDLPIKPTTGTTLSDCGGWVEAVWDVPSEIQEYVTCGSGDAVSFQFWYGDNTDSGYTQLKEVTLKSATCTYTVEKTIPYNTTESLSVSEKLTQGDDKTNTASIKLSDLNLDENSKLGAVKFTVSCPSEIKKLVFGVGVSDKNSADQYSGFQYAILEAGKTQEIMWIIPDDVIADGKYGNLTFGYYYGADSSDKLVNS